MKLVIELTVILFLLNGCGKATNEPLKNTGAEPASVASSRLAGLLGAGDAVGFPRVTGPREFRFPEDHGSHPQYRNEWWYVTGNLGAENGDRFGYELTLFRFAMMPEARQSRSAWRANQVYVGHFALTDPQNRRFYTAERYSRAGPGLAGAQATPFRVWLDDWEIVAVDTPAAEPGETRWRLRAADGDVSVDLMLAAQKAPVLNGDNGLSQKSEEAGNASYYYSITRLQTDGTVRTGAQSVKVTGHSWLDREWGSSALAADQVGWDWFALQFDEGTELMFYNIRGRDGEQGTKSAGTWVAADGRSRQLRRDDVRLAVLDSWESPLGGRYPSRWRLTVAELELEVEIVPILPGQELSTAVRYWEGAVDVAGVRSGQTVRGRGYVELTGYAHQD